jgi:hypothetical protein
VILGNLHDAQHQLQASARRHAGRVRVCASPQREHHAGPGCGVPCASPGRPGTLGGWLLGVASWGVVAKLSYAGALLTARRVRWPNSL